MLSRDCESPHQHMQTCRCNIARTHNLSNAHLTRYIEASSHPWMKLMSAVCVTEGFRWAGKKDLYNVPRISWAIRVSARFRFTRGAVPLLLPLQGWYLPPKQRAQVRQTFTSCLGTVCRVRFQTFHLLILIGATFHWDQRPYQAPEPIAVLQALAQIPWPRWSTSLPVFAPLTLRNWRGDVRIYRGYSQQYQHALAAMVQGGWYYGRWKDTNLQSLRCAARC